MLIATLCFVLGLSWWGTGWLARHSSAIKVLDYPNERSLHRTPTPRTGGLAIMLSFFLGVILLALGGAWPSTYDRPLLGWPMSFWLMGFTLLIAMVSFYDDHRGLPIAVRLSVQIAAASVLTIGGRLSLSSIDVPFVGLIDLGWPALAGSILFLVWMTNLYNFMDGMDGFAGGMTVVGFGCLAYFAWVANHQFIFATALILSVASLGFLFHNFPPASIFMGDVGSVSIGFISGSLIVLGCRDRVFTFWVPVILFSPFIVDATNTLVRRALRRQKVWEAHREHYYQRLVLLGWGHRRTVIAEYGFMCGCAALACIYQFGAEWVRAVVLLVWCTALVSLMAGVRWAERTAIHSKQVS